MIPGIFIRYALNSGGGCTGDLIITGWRDIENNVASEVHVERFKSKVVGINKLQDVQGGSVALSLLRFGPSQFSMCFGHRRYLFPWNRRMEKEAQNRDVFFQFGVPFDDMCLTLKKSDKTSFAALHIDTHH